ncbi:hypothetical protein F0562_015140 [Nyssa sinensis]|uniref:Uncharacterized protein n=1 Tax=Nyssa sinensis TaxID=561372 RepID=A0A5J4ZJC6_9ASTE|nr:hypothetical protein F0562_015140 [Nyssa sinensis]
MAGASSRDPSCFDPPLHRIKDDSDLTTYISKYEDVFLANMIIDLGGKKENPRMASSEYSEVELSHAYAVKDRDWSHFLDPNRQTIRGSTIDVLEPGLIGIPIGIPSEQ